MFLVWLIDHSNCAQDYHLIYKHTLVFTDVKTCSVQTQQNMQVDWDKHIIALGWFYWMLSYSTGHVSTVYDLTKAGTCNFRLILFFLDRMRVFFELLSRVIFVWNSLLASKIMPTHFFARNIKVCNIRHISTIDQANPCLNLNLPLFITLCTCQPHPQTPPVLLYHKSTLERASAFYATSSLLSSVF